MLTVLSRSAGLAKTLRSRVALDERRGHVVAVRVDVRGHLELLVRRGHCGQERVPRRLMRCARRAVVDPVGDYALLGPWEEHAAAAAASPDTCGQLHQDGGLGYEVPARLRARELRRRAGAVRHAGAGAV